MVVFISQSQIIIINVFVATTTSISTTYMHTCLIIIRITTAVAQIRPSYFGIRIITIKSES
jgi:hypothetical protein